MSFIVCVTLRVALLYHCHRVKPHLQFEISNINNNKNNNNRNKHNNSARQ
jgi:hypothetical protein